MPHHCLQLAQILLPLHLPILETEKKQKDGTVHLLNLIDGEAGSSRVFLLLFYLQFLSISSQESAC